MANEFARNRQDAAVNPATFALPSSASSSTNSAAIDLGTTNPKLSDIELEIVAPALNTTQLPDTRTVTYSVWNSASSSGGFARILDGIIIQTGASSAGAATQTKRVKLPTSTLRYVDVTATTGGSTGNCSAASCTVRVLF